MGNKTSQPPRATAEPPPYPTPEHEHAMQDDDKDDPTGDWTPSPFQLCVCGEMHNPDKWSRMFWVQCKGCKKFFDVFEGCVGFSEEEAAGNYWQCNTCEPPKQITHDAEPNPTSEVESETGDELEEQSLRNHERTKTAGQQPSLSLPPALLLQGMPGEVAARTTTTTTNELEESCSKRQQQSPTGQPSSLSLSLNDATRNNNELEESDGRHQLQQQSSPAGQDEPSTAARPAIIVARPVGRPVGRPAAAADKKHGGNRKAVSSPGHRGHGKKKHSRDDTGFRNRDTVASILSTANNNRTRSTAAVATSTAAAEDNDHDPTRSAASSSSGRVSSKKTTTTKKKDTSTSLSECQNDDGHPILNTAAAKHTGAEEDRESALHTAKRGPSSSPSEYEVASKRSTTSVDDSNDGPPPPPKKKRVRITRSCTRADSVSQSIACGTHRNTDAKDGDSFSFHVGDKVDDGVNVDDGDSDGDDELEAVSKLSTGYDGPAGNDDDLESHSDQHPQVGGDGNDFPTGNDNDFVSPDTAAAPDTDRRRSKRKHHGNQELVSSSGPPGPHGRSRKKVSGSQNETTKKKKTEEAAVDSDGDGVHQQEHQNAYPEEEAVDGDGVHQQEHQNAYPEEEAVDGDGVHQQEHQNAYPEEQLYTAFNEASLVGKPLDHPQWKDFVPCFPCTSELTEEKLSEYRAELRGLRAGTCVKLHLTCSCCGLEYKSTDNDPITLKIDENLSDDLAPFVHEKKGDIWICDFLRIPSHLNSLEAKKWNKIVSTVRRHLDECDLSQVRPTPRHDLLPHQTFPTNRVLRLVVAKRLVDDRLDFSVRNDVQYMSSSCNIPIPTVPEKKKIELWTKQVRGNFYGDYFVNWKKLMTKPANGDTWIFTTKKQKNAFLCSVCRACWEIDNTDLIPLHRRPDWLNVWMGGGLEHESNPCTAYKYNPTVLPPTNLPFSLVESPRQPILVSHGLTQQQMNLRMNGLQGMSQQSLNQQNQQHPAAGLTQQQMFLLHSLLNINGSRSL